MPILTPAMTAHMTPEQVHGVRLRDALSAALREREAEDVLVCEECEDNDLVACQHV